VVFIVHLLGSTLWIDAGRETRAKGNLMLPVRSKKTAGTTKKAKKSPAGEGPGKR
jgi:hypothetical protein